VDATANGEFDEDLVKMHAASAHSAGGGGVLGTTSSQSESSVMEAYASAARTAMKNAQLKVPGAEWEPGRSDASRVSD